MSKRWLVLCLVSVLLMAGCGFVPPSVPTGLTATGSLRQINLQWTAATGSVEGYNIYRGLTPQGMTLLGSIPAGNTYYSDTTPLEGQVYHYCVKAYTDKGEETEASNLVSCMQGTRITSTAEDVITQTPQSPYVIEGNVQFGGDLTVSEGTKVYVQKGSTINFTSSASAMIHVEGFLGAEGTVAEPVVFSSTGGGYSMLLSGLNAPFSRFRYVRFRNLNGLVTAINIAWGSPQFSNCDFSVTPGGMRTIRVAGTAPEIGYCLFQGLTLSVEVVPIGTGAIIKKNIFAGAIPILLIHDLDASEQPFLSDQIQANVFECGGTAATSRTVADISLEAINYTGSIPLAGNFFGRKSAGTKEYAALTAQDDFFVYSSNNSASLNLTGVLNQPPSDAGPNW